MTDTPATAGAERESDAVQASDFYRAQSVEWLLAEHGRLVSKKFEQQPPSLSETDDLRLACVRMRLDMWELERPLWNTVAVPPAGAPRLSAAELDAIEARAKAATSGPWTVETMRPHTLGPAWVNAVDVSRVADCSDPTRIYENGKQVCHYVEPEEREANAAHVAGMDPPTTLALVAMARRTL